MMKKEQINEHDMTKKMLDTIRKPLITENVAPSEGIDLSGRELQEEQNVFKDNVTEMVEFEVFKVYPQVNNVVFAGIIESSIEWQYSYHESNGVYITTNNLQLTDELVETVRKLKAYFGIWRANWAKKLATEYKNNNNNNGGMF